MSGGDIINVHSFMHGSVLQVTRHLQGIMRHSTDLQGMRFRTDLQGIMRLSTDLQGMREAAESVVLYANSGQCCRGICSRAGNSEGSAANTTHRRGNIKRTYILQRV